MATHSRIPMDRGAWRATVHGVPELDMTEATQCAHAHTHTHTSTKHSVVYMCRLFSSHSLVDEHLDCFHVLAIMTSAAMNIEMPVSFQIVVLSGDMPRSRIAGS